MVGIRRFDVVLVRLDATLGSEIRKTRPCIIISPDEINQVLRTALVAPMTTKGSAYPWRVPVTFGGKAGRIALDQIRTVDEQRLARRLGSVDGATAQRVLDTLVEMCAP